MSNVNNLNGIPNFGHGEDVVPTPIEEPSIDEVSSPDETKVEEVKIHKSKVRSAANKALGGKY